MRQASRKIVLVPQHIDVPLVLQRTSRLPSHQQAKPPPKSAALQTSSAASHAYYAAA